MGDLDELLRLLAVDAGPVDLQRDRQDEAAALRAQPDVGGDGRLEASTPRLPATRVSALRKQAE